MRLSGFPAVACLVAALFAGGAAAQSAKGVPVDKGWWLQKAETVLAEDVHSFFNFVLVPIMGLVVLVVLLLMGVLLVRYNKKANPEPNRFSHNTMLEIVWTGIPVCLLVIICFFSFDLLHKQDITPDGRVLEFNSQGTEYSFANDFPPSRTVASPKHINVFLRENTGEMTLLKRGGDYTLSGLGGPRIDVSLKDAPYNQEVVIHAGRSVDRRGRVVVAPAMTIKANGFQWGWSYSYPDFGDFSFVSNLLPKDQLEDKSLYLLATDTNVVVPTGVTVRLLTTASDVIHAWAIPSFALKIDAVPGRVNSTWFRVEEGNEGFFYGQCSELCGINHAFMPITVQAVSLADFCNWTASMKSEFGVEETAENNPPLCANSNSRLAAAPEGAQILMQTAGKADKTSRRNQK